jgi:hypothetical protein
VARTGDTRNSGVIFVSKHHGRRPHGGWRGEDKIKLDPVEIF